MKLADGNQLFTKLTTNSVYQFVNTYKLADTTTPDNPGPNPEPGDSGGGGGTDNPPPTDNGGSGGTDNTVTDDPDTTEPGTTDTPDEPEMVEPGETVEPKPVEPVEELPADVPETGDNSHVALYVALLFAAVAGAVAVRRQGNFR